MAGLDLKLDPGTLASIASAAIFEQLPQQARDLLIQQAIEHLMTPDRSSHHLGTKTPLQRAFEDALVQATHTIVREKVQSDPRIKEAIDDLVGPIITACIVEEAKDYRSEMADSVGRALSQWLQDKARS